MRHIINAEGKRREFLIDVLDDFFGRYPNKLGIIGGLATSDKYWASAKIILGGEENDS